MKQDTVQKKDFSEFCHEVNNQIHKLGMKIEAMERRIDELEQKTSDSERAALTQLGKGD